MSEREPPISFRAYEPIKAILKKRSRQKNFSINFYVNAAIAMSEGIAPEQLEQYRRK